MMLPALLVGAATGVLWLRPPSARRLRALVPVLPPSASPRRSVGRGVVTGGTGFVLWLVVGGWPGAALGAAVAVLGPR
ncbi:MAG: hypothetical protein M3P04_13965, partial [Actinomycetota bacterium]|nr:hypothetical protein [Actinomycetota bacterium]